MMRKYWSRREVLQVGIAGVVASALMSFPTLLQSRSGVGSVGLLLPEMANTPLVATQLLAGLQRGMQERGITASVRVPSAASADGVTLGEELLAQGAKVIVGAMSVTQAQRLLPQVEAAGAMLILATAGETIAERPLSPALRTVSLGYWQASWAAGYQTVERFGPRVALIANVYESGFEPFFAFQQGVIAAGGHVGLPLLAGPGHLSVNEALAAALAQRPDAIYFAGEASMIAPIVAGAGATPVVLHSFAPEFGGVANGYRVTGWATTTPFESLGYAATGVLADPRRATPTTLVGPLQWHAPQQAAQTLAAIPEVAICAECAALGVRSHWTNRYLPR